MDHRFRGRTARCKHILFVLLRVLAVPPDDACAGAAPRRIPADKLAALLAAPAHRAAEAAPHIIARFEALVRGEAVAALPPRAIDADTNVCAIWCEPATSFASKLHLTRLLLSEQLRGAGCASGGWRRCCAARAAGALPLRLRPQRARGLRGALGGGAPPRARARHLRLLPRALGAAAQPQAAARRVRQHHGGDGQRRRAGVRQRSVQHAPRASCWPSGLAATHAWALLCLLLESAAADATRKHVYSDDSCANTSLTLIASVRSSSCCAHERTGCMPSQRACSSLRAMLCRSPLLAQVRPATSASAWLVGSRVRRSVPCQRARVLSGAARVSTAPGALP